MIVALLAVTFLDELASGVAPAGAPTIATDLGLAPGRLAGLALAAFAGLALLLEPFLLPLGERVVARRFIGVSLAAIAVAALGASLSPSLILLLVALALYGPASGCAVATAEGALVESAPEQRERTLARITLAGVIGDLTVPALLALLPWREAFGIAAAFAAVLAIVIASSRALGRPIAGEEEPSGEVAGLRGVLRERPAVLAWSLADIATNLMDEVLTAFLVVHVHERIDASPGSLSLALGALIAGNLAGLAALDRVLTRVAPMRALAVSGALAIPVLAVLVVTRELAVAVPLLFALGAMVSTYHPLVKARAYAALPGRPGIVNAVVSMLGPLDIGAALAIGELARAFGSQAALGALGVVPILMVLVARRR